MMKNKSKFIDNEFRKESFRAPLIRKRKNSLIFKLKFFYNLVSYFNNHSKSFKIFTLINSSDTLQSNFKSV